MKRTTMVTSIKALFSRRILNFTGPLSKVDDDGGGVSLSCSLYLSFEGAKVETLSQFRFEPSRWLICKLRVLNLLGIMFLQMANLDLRFKELETCKSNRSDSWASANLVAWDLLGESWSSARNKRTWLKIFSWLHRTRADEHRKKWIGIKVSGWVYF